MAKLQNEFRISDMQPNSIALLHADRDQFELDPDYQRISDVWTKSKKQLLIDSLLNGFDIPKIYLYELNPQKRQGERASSRGLHHEALSSRIQPGREV